MDSIRTIIVDDELLARRGLKNVTDRLRGLFPGTARFEMENGATGGALALLSVPFADAETTAVAESV